MGSGFVSVFGAGAWTGEFGMMSFGAAATAGSSAFGGACAGAAVGLRSTDPIEVEFQASWTWFTQSLDDIWIPLVVGSQVLGILLAGLGYLVIDALWRDAIKRQWQARQRKRNQ